MRTWVIRVVAAAALGATVFGLMEVTQNRPDPIREDVVSDVELKLSARHGRAGIDDATALWGVCQRTAAHVRLDSPIEVTAPQRFSIKVRPALGHHDQKRFVGCLEDATLDGLVGRVSAIRELAGT